MKKESGCMWRPLIGVLAIGVLAFGLSLQGAALHQGSSVSSSDRAVNVAAPPPLTVTGAVGLPKSNLQRMGNAAALGDDVRIKYPTVNNGSRVDDCNSRGLNSGDNCEDIAIPALLSPRECTISGDPCLLDSDCAGGGDVCDTTNILYLSGDVSLATFFGTCSTSGGACEYDEDCPPLGTCSSSGLPCNANADCGGGQTCSQENICENLPCSVTHDKVCSGGGLTNCEETADCPAGETCDFGDRGWFEAFELTECSNVSISFCCGQLETTWIVMFGGANCSGGLCDHTFRWDSNNGDLCDNGALTIVFDNLPAGVYYYPMYAGSDYDASGAPAQYTIRLDAMRVSGACCTGPTFTTCTNDVTPCDCSSQGGSYLGDNTTCDGSPPPCEVEGACCGSNGAGCTLVSAGACTGVFAGPGTNCDEPCCPMDETGVDDCANIMPVTVPVPGKVTMTGDNTGATGVCTDRVDFFTAFTLDTCASVVIDWCCTTDISLSPIWGSIDRIDGPDCCDAQGISSDDVSFAYGGGLADCDGPGAFLFSFDELGPGTYMITGYFEDPAVPSNFGEYTVHVSAQPLARNLMGACCEGTYCRITCEADCNNAGGTFQGTFSTCTSDPPLCDDPSACCAPNGSCSAQLYDDCLTSGSSPYPGLSCAEVNCPTPTADECPDAITINCDTPRFGDNTDATNNWGRCSSSGAICGSVITGDAPNHDDCPEGTCDVGGAPCHQDSDCTSGPCSGGETCERAGAPWVDPFFPCAWRTAWYHFNPDIGNNTVWYKFVAEETSVYLATCNSTDPGLLDTALMLYRYTNGSTNETRCGSLVMMDDPDEQFDGCGEDECPYEDPAAPWFSEICSCALTIDTTYYVEVINSGGNAAPFQLTIDCPCLDCRPGACCETVGNRCFDFFGFQDPPVPVSTAGCNADSECLDEPGCNNPGDCICLPFYFCNDNVEDFECPTNPNSISSRYGGNGTTCEPEVGVPQISPECGTGACCFGNNCSADFSPLLCLGDIGQGQSWNGEGSECVSGNDNLECPKACTLDGYGHPNDTPPEDTFRSDSTGNGICEGGVIECTTDGMCTTSGLTGTCLGEGVQIVADSFIPLQTPISELCWWGVFRRDDAGGSADDCADDVTAAGVSNFTIRFLEDADCDGEPEGVVPGGTFTDVPVLRSGSGVDISPEFEWEFHHGFTPVSVTPGGCYFVEMTATNSPANCVFRIKRSTVGDVLSAIDTDEDGVYDATIGSDVAWTMDVPVVATDCLPLNDDCADVITIGAGTTGLSGVVQLFQTTYASDDGVAHPKNLCGIGGVGTYKVRNEVWYRYTAQCSGLLTVDVCSSGYDTAMVVYNMNMGTNGNVWTCPADDELMVGCTNNDCGTIGLQSLIADIPVAAGEKILIKLGGHGPFAVGCGVMRLTVDLGTSGCTTNGHCPDDGVYCNGNEFCDLGACQCAHTGQDCPDDGLFCNGDEICIEAANTCGHTGDPCPDDGLFCTGTESCNEGTDTCEQTGDPCPDDGLFCTGTESCNEGTDTCEQTGDPCLGGLECADACNEGAGDCFNPGGTACGDPSNTDCDNPDTCDGAGNCEGNLELNGSDCDDGLFCNGADTCTSGVCTHAGDPCDPDPCIEAANTCGVAGGPCGIVSMESCFNHGGACGVLCLPIDCTNCGSVEPRLQLGVPPTLVLDLGTCGCDSASVAVSCAPNAYGGSASVICDGSSTATVTFSGPLPDRSCCTLTFSGDIVDVRTLALLEGDVNRDCGVSASDTGSTEARVGRITTDPLGGTPYDVNRDCSIAASDFSSVSARVGRVVPPCPCP